jgi:hypothetical protein
VSLAQHSARVAARVLRHEWTLAILACLAVAAFLNRASLADPSHTLPHDVWDPSLEAYLVAWDGHALLHNPLGIWQINAFYPAPDGLAFSDSLLGYAPFAIIGTGPEAAVLRYNLLFVAAQALVLFGGYALARQLGLRPGAAVLAAVAVAVPPWRLAQTGHLNIVSTGGILLALAMLARGHGIRWLRRPDDPTPSRPGWIVAGWLVATWQLSLGFGVGIPFTYVLLGCLLVGGGVWLVRHRTALRAGWRSALPPGRVLAADAAGGLFFAVVALVLARPYLRVLEMYPYTRRSVAYVALYSPPVRGLFTAPAESTPWGSAQAAGRALMTVPGEMALLPGFAVYALAAVGLFRSVWPARVRIGLAVGAAAFLVLSLGTNGPAHGQLGYLLLLHLPGFEGIRVPGRMILWATMLLALLAAGAAGALGRWARAAAMRQVAQQSPAPAREAALAAWVVRSPAPAPQSRAAADRTPTRRSAGVRALVRAAVLLPAFVVFLEGSGSVPAAPMPAAPPTLSTVAPPYLVLPTQEIIDMHLMLWSTDRFAAMANGGSSLVPTQTQRLRDAVKTFPDQASVAYLRGIGIRTVVVLPAWARGTPLANAATRPIDGLPMSRQVGIDAVVFTLDP